MITALVVAVALLAGIFLTMEIVFSLTAVPAATVIFLSFFVLSKESLELLISLPYFLLCIWFLGALWCGVFLRWVWDRGHPSKKYRGKIFR
ncbi:MAG: hypothetical protein A3D67_02515 [Candidatus Lloydbacteria bacterium RIFCSPHIGHO2_02_FULL_51_22]|uniref:Uncharacterized protein n=2 Tax=Candidatus Lloydiibacteriota TaxID=1817910 RepID=A0A1G2DEZ5_9BACT|nr:MAG: hypothetical protein A3D67_02515 [Candidatus Lloydbacteria bacterium RIFCSPHIGHO2_02_FULL_51_22]OGZ15907.1 MAG: hypothetical protein A3G11_02320 [Candidatus Lloydbacteria bacterium RIFCSPLOWO2_12_FULL_51_9]